MRNKFILSVLLLALATGMGWAQFWQNYSDKERQTLGEAYWLAGNQYQAVGKSAKGSDFISIAKLMYPQLDPSTIVDQALPSAAELLALGRATAIGAGATAVPSASLSSFFLRFAGVLLDEDSAGVADFLDGSIYLTRIPQEVSRADVPAALDAFFKQVTLQGLEPSAVYDLNSVVVNATPQPMQKAWGETYTLAVTAREDFSRFVSFWDMKQVFYVHRVGGNWKILGFGQAAPPLTWSPQKAAAVAVAAPAAGQPDAGSAITDAFTACVSDLLKMDAEGTLGYMSTSIRFLRLRQTVTSDELKTTLQGYFDNADFGAATIADVLDMESIFVEPASSPVDGVSGPVYLLNVKAKADLTASIPFWSMYQKYYFARDGADWRIFAIL